MSLHSPYRAVLFDLDGTLLDTVPDLACAANRMLGELHRPELSEALVSTFVGRGITKLVERVLAGSIDGTVPADQLQHGLAIFERCYAEESGQRSRPYPGVTAGLDRLAAAAMPMAVVTNKAARFTLELLERVGLKSYFKAVVSGDTLAVRKPHPEPVRHACRQLGVSPADALFIGDSRHDVEAGLGAGCAVWCVPYGYNEGVSVESLKCQRIVPDIEVAANLILGSEVTTVT